MNKTLNLTGVLACLILSALVFVASEPWARSRTSPFAFEATVGSDHSGLVQLYFDTGRGMNEPDSVLQPIIAGKPRLLRFALPYGRYQALRFDPLDRDAEVSVSGARIVDASGSTLVSFEPGQFRVNNEILSLAIRDGVLVIRTTPYATDPSLYVALADAFVIRRPPLWLGFAKVLAATLALLAFVGWAVRSPRVRLAARFSAAWSAARAYPRATIAALALASTAAANYPVVFAGRSFVSPNLGVSLLYGQSPWLPGFQSSEVLSPHMSDVAALLWHHLPLSMIERRAVVRDGELPLWNRYDSSGVPLLGQGQSCFGDPLQLIPVIADGASWAWDAKILLAKWLFACGIGLCAWRAFGHFSTASLVAVSSAFVGFFVYRINHPAIFSFCYSPWILYAWLGFLGARTSSGVALWLSFLVGADWCEMNSGTAKEAYVLLLGINFAGLCVLLASESPASLKIRQFAYWAASGCVFALIGSPVWYTFYRALRRAYTSYNLPEVFQIQPGTAVGVFDEAFYRPFQVDSGVINPSANFFILIGVLWAAVCWRSLLANRIAVGLAAASIPMLAVVFGVVPPALVARIPFVGNIFHIDNTVSCCLIVLFAVLAAFGWREACARAGTPEWRREAAIVVTLVALLLAAYFGTAQAVVRSAFAGDSWGRLIELPRFIYGYGALLLVASAALLWALDRAVRHGPSAGAVICAFTAFGVLHWREAEHLGGAYADYVVEPARRTNLQAHSAAVATILARELEPCRTIGFNNDLLPGWSGVYGIEGISGPDALVNPYYRELLDASGVGRVWDWRYLIAPSDVSRLKKILDALNIRYFLGYHLGRARPGSELTEIASEDMDVYESATPWPRAFFTDSVAVYDNLQQFTSWLFAGDGRPFAGIQHSDWVRLRPVPDVPGDLSRRIVCAARAYTLTTNSTSFTVDAASRGFIVLTEAFEDGNFIVTVNGRRVPYVRINYAFKGVYVDAPGTYEVRFSYWPRGFTTTLALFWAGLGAVVCAVAAALLGRQGRRVVRRGG